jgi:hypothetical protein
MGIPNKEIMAMKKKCIAESNSQKILQRIVDRTYFPNVEESSVFKFLQENLKSRYFHQSWPPKDFSQCLCKICQLVSNSKLGLPDISLDDEEFFDLTPDIMTALKNFKKMRSDPKVFDNIYL